MTKTDDLLHKWSKWFNELFVLIRASARPVDVVMRWYLVFSRLIQAGVF